jgi:hypothetical protein
MDIDKPFDLGIDDIMDFQYFSHDSNDFVDICIVEVEDDPRTYPRWSRAYWRRRWSHWSDGRGYGRGWCLACS